MVYKYDLNVMRQRDCPCTICSTSLNCILLIPFSMECMAYAHLMFATMITTTTNATEINNTGYESEVYPMRVSIRVASI